MREEAGPDDEHALIAQCLQTLTHLEQLFWIK